MIAKLLVSDIDGVLTDGKLVLDTRGNEYKSICARDLDPLTWLKNKGVVLALLTGEDSPMVDVIGKRLGVDRVVKGAKDKEEKLRLLSQTIHIPLENICFIGDADRDASALKICGLSMVPADATAKAKKSAMVVLRAKGGDGVIQEAMEYMLANKCLDENINTSNPDR